MLDYENQVQSQPSFFTSSGTQKRVAIYARVSTIEQAEEGYSIDEQVKLLSDLSEREGYNIHKEYVDRGKSGKNIKGRPALQQLLQDAANKEFDMLFVWKVNRLSRKTKDLLNIVEALEGKNIVFRSYTERYETETPAGKMQFRMLAVIAEFERDNIAQNVKMGMLARAREGSWNGGQVLGYDVVNVPQENRKRKNSQLVINPKEAQTVRKIFELYTQGNGYKAITSQLNKEGHLTKKKKYFSINSIRTILTNPLYAGYIRYNVRRDWNEKRRNNINPHPIIEKGQHEALISMEVWEKTKIIMESRGGKPNRVHSGEFPLTGIMRCPVCNAGMVIGRTTNKLKDGTKRVLEYYVCGAWKNKGTAVCRSNGVRTDYADTFVFEKISSIASSEALLKQIVDRINNKKEEDFSPAVEEYQALKQTLEGIENRKARILGLYEESIINKTDLANRLAELTEKKKQLEERLAPLELQLGEGKEYVIDFSMVKGVMQDFKKAYQDALSREQRKRLVHLLIHQITIGEDRKIDTIQIQLNKEVVKYFASKGGENSSVIGEFSPPFSIYIDL